MRAVSLRVRAGLRQDWRSPLVLAVITGLMGSLVLVSLAGARRTGTAVPRFLAWSGPVLHAGRPPRRPSSTPHQQH
jgi:hypothetical protein